VIAGISFGKKPESLRWHLPRSLGTFIASGYDGMPSFFIAKKPLSAH
jgi:hypothetical protein